MASGREYCWTGLLHGDAGEFARRIAGGGEGHIRTRSGDRGGLRGPDDEVGARIELIVPGGDRRHGEREDAAGAILTEYAETGGGVIRIRSLRQFRAVVNAVAVGVRAGREDDVMNPMLHYLEK